MPISRRRLAFATDGFLAAMHRAYFQRYPDRDYCTVPESLEAVKPEDRALLMASVEVALKRVEPAADAQFETWNEATMAEAS